MFHELFSTLGMSEKESSVFLKMLELGSQPVSVIARHLHMPRSSAYAVLDRLRELSLIEEFSRHGLKYVKCISVDNIADLLEGEKHRYESALENLQAHLPKLRSLESRLSITPKVKFFEGKNAVKKMYEDVLKEKEFYAFFNPESVEQNMPEYLFKIPEMLKANNGKAKEILVQCDIARTYQKKFHSSVHQIKLLPKKSIFYADWIIGLSTIYLISYGESSVSGTEVESKALAHTQRVIFEELWSRI